jgi:CubicO group peptidase (beta-lactamase class C family)
MSSAKPFVWETATPDEVGFDRDKLSAAIEFIEGNESKWPRSMYVEDGTYVGSAYVEDKPPYNVPLGPVVPRGGGNGLILRGGRLVASWGDIDRCDMTFSVAKSYLSVLCGLAVDRGLIRSIDERVGESVDDGGFSDPQNQPITWRNFLEQTSEWHGTLFDRPDSVDWNRQVGAQSDGRNKGNERALRRPGELYEYNDVRVNRFALSLLRVFREPLPQVLRREIMEPAGCFGAWRWEGYDNSWVDVGGTPMQSVPGGGHWGGGMIIGARDHAFLGELVLGQGLVRGRRILSPEWVASMLTPSARNRSYGLMWWLNTDRAQYSSVTESSVFALGAGQHLVWVDHPRDLVAVIRWLDKPVTDQALGLISDAIM